MKLKKDSCRERKIILIPVIMMFTIFCSLGGLAQDVLERPDTLRKDALKFYIDCRSCDMNYTRQEIPYVNYVRDTYEAQVYLLVTSQNAGNGGNQYTFSFQGFGRFKGMNDTLVYTSNPDETSPEIREKKTNLIKMGLMRYVARTPVFKDVEISYNSDLEQEEVVDTWNNWVFELRTSPNFNSEESYKRLFLANSVNIRKITPDIKLEIDLDQSTNKQKFVEDNEITEYIRSYKSARVLFVKSIGKHWAAGLRSDIRTSTSGNYDLNADIMPSVEYDIYPYSEATHRQFRILYSTGYEYSNYIDSTIYNKTEEGNFKQDLRIAYEVQEKWGSINVSLYGSTYLQDLKKNNVGLYGYIRLRIIRGLSLSVNGRFAYINNQLNLRKEDLTEAERLLRLKQQATNYDIDVGVSLTYTFGSIYNNIVNPRFGNGRY